MAIWKGSSIPLPVGCEKGPICVKFYSDKLLVSLRYGWGDPS